MEFNLSTLISEFNDTQKKSCEDDVHLLSLTKLCYHYKKFRYDVEIIETEGKDTSPDLMINGIKCDIKVRHDLINRDMRKYLHLIEKDSELYHKIFSSNIRSRDKDLKSALENRAQRGFEQADCLIMDLSNHFHSWNYHRIKSYINKHQTKEFSQKPLVPIPNVCIIFSPDNVRDLNVSEFKPKAYWTYVFWNPETREFIDPSTLLNGI